MEYRLVLVVPSRDPEYRTDDRQQGDEHIQDYQEYVAQIGESYSTSSRRHNQIAE
jgi:hypothetical protein